MGLFNNLMSKIFGQAPAAAQSGTSGSGTTGGAPSSAPGATSGAASGAGAQTQAPQQAGGAGAAQGTQPAAPTQPPQQQVDVAAILNGLAAKNSEKLDWKRSIVDLMKLVGMDSSLSARKELAKDLNYSGDMNDSAKMNMWLHKEVMRKLAENGGKVPQDLLQQ